MEDTTEIVAASPTDSEAIVLRQRGRRKQLRELLRTQQAQLQLLESGLSRQRQLWQTQLADRAAAAAESDATAKQADATLRDNERFAEDAAALAQLSDQLDQRQAELLAFEKRLQHQEQAIVDSLAEQQTHLDERAVELDMTDQQLRQLQRTLGAAEEALSIDREQVAHLRERLHQEIQSTEKEREELSDRRADLNNQRRRIARQLQQQRKAQKHEIEKERETLEDLRRSIEADQKRERGERDRQLAELARQRKQLADAAHAGDETLSTQLAGAMDESADLRRELAEIKQILNGRGDELETLRETQRKRAVEFDELRAERDQLLHQVETMAKTQAKTKSATSEADADLKKRFEIALDDVRDLKRRNAELEEQLAARPAGKVMAADAGGLDWESQKRRLLATLEADDSQDATRQQELLSIESTIHITDEIVNRKDRELAELRRVLEEQSSNLGSVAVGAQAFAEVLDADELIRQERENLVQLQAEWREKLKQAEIDISVERARIGRERMELEEKLQSLKAEKAQMAEDAEHNGPIDHQNPSHRRWWNRLGLKDKDGDEG